MQLINTMHADCCIVLSKFAPLLLMNDNHSIIWHLNVANKDILLFELFSRNSLILSSVEIFFALKAVSAQGPDLIGLGQKVAIYALVLKLAIETRIF